MITPACLRWWKCQLDFYFAAILKLKQEMNRLNENDLNKILRNADASRIFDTWFYDAGLK